MIINWTQYPRTHHGACIFRPIEIPLLQKLKNAIPISHALINLVEN